MKSGHPTRKMMIAAARSDRVLFAKHLANCEECRDLFSVFRAFPLAGESLLVGAPSGWITRAVAIAEKRLPRVIEKLLATLSFDSWQVAPALGVRGPESGKRRLQFSAGETTFDLQATRKVDHWQMTARINAKGAELGGCAFQANKQTLRPDDQGYVVWTAKQPPSQLTVQTQSHTITIPKLSWSSRKK